MISDLEYNPRDRSQLVVDNLSLPTRLEAVNQYKWHWANNNFLVFAFRSENYFNLRVEGAFFSSLK